MLSYFWLSSLGLLTTGLSVLGVSFTLPRFRKGEFGGIIDTGPVIDLPSVNDPPKNYPKGKFWLVRTDSGLIALYKACTHLDCLFNWNSQEDKFICPCHGSQFGRDGTLLSGPAPRSLDRFVVQIVSPEGKVLAETDSFGRLSLPSVENEATAKTPDEAPPKEDQSLIRPSGEGRRISPTSIIRVDTSRKIRGMRLGVSIQTTIIPRNERC
jgi:cytochrome b6-f complex iron-sulfur subunit